MPTHGYQLKEITKHALNALNSSNITDAEVNPLATAAALKALFVGRQSGHFQQRADMEFHEASIDAAIAAGVFPDAGVAAANTMDGLRDLVITQNPELTRTFQSGNRAWQ
jgi:hypothetical protein